MTDPAASLPLFGVLLVSLIWGNGHFRGAAEAVELSHTASRFYSASAFVRAEVAVADFAIKQSTLQTQSSRATVLSSNGGGGHHIRTSLEVSDGAQDPVDVGRARRRQLATGCSTTDASATSITECINAVRVDPDILADYVATCWTAQILASLKNPPRRALTASPALSTASKIHNDAMIAANKLSSSASTDILKAAMEAGYTPYSIGETVSQGLRNARDVVAQLSCNAGTRELLFSCSYSDVGVAAGSGYFTETFGCDNSTGCNSCGAVAPTTQSPRSPPPSSKSPPPRTSPPPTRTSPPPHGSPSLKPPALKPPAPKPPAPKPPAPKPPAPKPPAPKPPAPKPPAPKPPAPKPPAPHPGSLPPTRSPPNLHSPPSPVKTPSPTATACSNTDLSATAIIACINAVRVNPSLLSDTPCYESVKASVLVPVRKPFQITPALNAAATLHNDLMVANKQVAAGFTGEPSLGDRLKASNYPFTYVAEQYSLGPSNAHDLVSRFFCSPSSRNSMFACNLTDIGVASKQGYVTQTFGCQDLFCNSC